MPNGSQQGHSSHYHDDSTCPLSQALEFFHVISHNTIKVMAEDRGVEAYSAEVKALVDKIGTVIPEDTQNGVLIGAIMYMVCSIPGAYLKCTLNDLMAKVQRHQDN